MTAQFKARSVVFGGMPCVGSFQSHNCTRKSLLDAGYEWGLKKGNHSGEQGKVSFERY